MPDTFTVDALDDAPDSVIDGSCDTDGGADDTPCTLRAAIAESNANADDDSIEFDPAIAGAGCQGTPATCTITVSSPSLSVSDTVTINGCSTDPNRAQPCVAVQGSTQNFSMMLVNPPNSTIRGLAFINSLGGLRLGAIAHGSTIKNNWFGLDLDGTAAGNSVGLQVSGNNNTIGGPGGATGSSPADRNVFAGNTLSGGNVVGLQIFDGSGAGDNNVVQGNYFGTNPEGTAAIPNGDNVNVLGNGANRPTGNVIGGTITGPAAATPECDGACNLIAAADGSGSALGNGINLPGNGSTEVPPDQTIVKGNYIGTDVSGTGDLGNTAAGVKIGNPSFFAGFGDGNTIGGDTAAEENRISNNGTDGIQVLDTGSGANIIARNRGAGNGSVPNDLFIDVGADGPTANGPTILKARAGAATGTAQAGATVRVFRKNSASPGELGDFLGQATANGSSQWQATYSSNAANGQLVTATQTPTGGNTSELAAPVATDAVPPQTSITSGPANGATIGDPAPSFGFSSEAGASFQCRVDSGPFGECSGPGASHTTANLSEGQHTFRVRALDTAGNPDPTPATRSFTVADPPETAITKGPKKKTKKKKVGFEFSSDEAGSMFECSLDGAGFSPCASPLKVKAKKRRGHELRVRATDQAGNTDDSPATYTWKRKKKRK